MVAANRDVVQRTFARSGRDLRPTADCPGGGDHGP
jgi:hypothetical protein